MITEDYVSFEVAKLLKEKGFDEPCRTYYFYKKFKEVNYYEKNSDGIYLEEVEYCTAPTHQMAMKWLREVHHLYVQVMLGSGPCGGHTRYYVVIHNTTSGFEMMFFEMMLQDALDNVFYDSYEDAVEAAIKYCLENLI